MPLDTATIARADAPPFRKGDMARIANRPLLPAVLITLVQSLPWHDGTARRRPMWRIHWRHVADGFGHAPQYCDEPRDGRLVQISDRVAGPRT